MATSTRMLVALVVLPQEYNPDARAGRRKVEEEKFHETMEEIAAKFGGGVLWSFGGQSPQGFWWDRGVLYSDEVNVIEVTAMSRSKKLIAPVTLFAAIEQEQHEALRQLAFAQRRSLADVTRDALSEYITRHARSDRGAEPLRRAALADDRKRRRASSSHPGVAKKLSAIG